MMNKKWYEKNLAIILLLILLFPVGTLLMWKYSNWNKVIKIVISIFLGIVLVSSIGTNKNKVAATKIDNSTVQEQSKEEPKQEEKKDETVTQTNIQPGITKEYIESKLRNEKVEIISISDGTDNYYTIDFKVREVVNDSYYKKNILGEVKDISKVLNDAGLVKGNEFFFEAKGPGKDKYANEVDMNYATGYVKGDELAKCNFDKLNAEDMEKILQSFGLQQSLK